MSGDWLWLILLAPLAAAGSIALVFGRARALSAAISVSAALVMLGCTAALFLLPDVRPPEPFRWIDLGGLQLSVGLTIDRLSKGMLAVVAGVGTLIHIYSLGYMKDDEGWSRFFAGLSLFMFSMAGIVLADGFVMMFIFWELVGVSSYLLIGHWFTRAPAAAAANKAFIVNRIGDFGFLLGILLLWSATGTVLFGELRGRVAALDPMLLTAGTLLVFCGAVGKSAQFPLHVWLPDAMEGPTPVSALIHAATMVAAGVYMLVRVGFLVDAAPDAQGVIAWIGGVTALMAALMATQQNDIKRVLAYSTLSQLGLMVMAVGVAAGSAAMFHLFTHAFFKALLFLGAGAVIHSLHHEQDIWKMGGLRKAMPVTFGTFLVGTLALAGMPGLSGFFSKDQILAAALGRDPALFAVGLTTSFLTSFYMFRLLVPVFFGAPRSEAAGHAREAPSVMTAPLLALAALSAVGGYAFFAAHFLDLPGAAAAGGGHGGHGGHGEHGGPGHALVAALAAGAFVAGAALGVALYRGRAADPVLLPLFARKFYIDEIYDATLRRAQDALAELGGWIDRWVIDGVFVRGGALAAWGLGFALRLFQVGNVQAYAFLTALGAAGLIWFLVLR